MRKGVLAGMLGRLVVAVAVFLFLPATNVLLLTTPAFIAREYRQPRMPGADRYDAPTRLQLSQATVRWLNSGEDIEGLRALRRGDEAVYNERELRHMADVKVVYVGLRWVWRIAGLALLVAILGAALWPAWRRSLARGTFLGGALLVAAIGGVLLSALVSFDFFFVHFHQVFFAADTWTFDYADSLIQFYPLEFWIDITWILGAATLVEGLLVGALSSVWLRRLSRQGS